MTIETAKYLTGAAAAKYVLINKIRLRKTGDFPLDHFGLFEYQKWNDEFGRGTYIRPAVEDPTTVFLSQNDDEDLRERLQEQLQLLCTRMKDFTCVSFEDRLCQSEISMKCATFLKTLLFLQVRDVFLLIFDCRPYRFYRTILMKTSCWTTVLYRLSLLRLSLPVFLCRRTTLCRNWER